jgi:abortive infection bacteriophage resistance protein
MNNFSDKLQSIKNQANNYKKPFKTYDELLELLKARKLTISNEAYALLKLKHIGYYRLSAYFLPLQYKKNSDKANMFLPNISFEDILELYYFDTKLRRLIFEAIERIEIYFRTQIAHCHSAEYGAFGYLDKENLKCSQELFDQLQDSISKEKDRSRESFISHFKKKYNSTDLPIWAVVEVISMSTLSKLYASLKTSEQQKIVKPFDKINKDVLYNWFHALTVVRNTCAHHARLWNKILGVKFEVPKKHDGFKKIGNSNDKVFFAVSVIEFILESIGEELEFKMQIKTLLKEYPSIDLKAMGFVDDWEDLAIWSEYE